MSLEYVKLKLVFSAKFSSFLMTNKCRLFNQLDNVFLNLKGVNRLNSTTKVAIIHDYCINYSNFCVIKNHKQLKRL